MNQLEITRANYDAMAGRYLEYISEPANRDPFVDALLEVFAGLVADREGPPLVADVGCGPGHRTAQLDHWGMAVRGIDLAPAMIGLARQHYPGLRFDIGSLLELDIADATLGGLLSHFSVIHTPPAEVPAALDEFARVLAPGGCLLLSFQSGDDSLATWAAFDHTVAPAFRWSITAMANLLRARGFAEIARLRVEPGSRNRFHEGHLLMRKIDGCADPRR